MPRRKTILQSEIPYHVTGRCINKEWFDLPMPTVWDIFSDYLFFISKAYGVEIISFVLMNNHFHMILRTPKSNLDEAMNYFMRETSRSLSFTTGRINQTWGAPYHWCLLNTYSYFLNAYKYIYQNPVQSGQVLKCEDYHYSTLQPLLGKQTTIIPVAEDTVLFDGCFLKNLAWLNNTTPEDFLVIGEALKKYEFAYPKDRTTGREKRENDFIL